MPVTPVAMIALYLFYTLGIDYLYLDKIAVIAILLICFFSIEIDVTTVLKVVKTDQHIFGMIAILVFTIMLFSEALRTEGDTVTDSLVLYVLALTYYA